MAWASDRTPLCGLSLIHISDLLGVLDDFDPSRAAVALRSLGRDTPMIRTAARRTLEIRPWLDWLEQQLERPRAVLSGSRPRLAAAVGV